MAFTVSKTSYKTGVDEIEGLATAIKSALDPATQWLRDKAYWDKDLLPESTEYKSRDGFIPYSHNLGGMGLSLHIPECESYSWSFLEFGEWDGEHYCDGKDKDNCECPYASDGEYDAHLRIWLKLERVETNKLSFYLYAGGGNADAPYFRTKYEPTLYESEFTARSLTEVVIKGRAAVRKMIKKLDPKAEVGAA